MTRLTVDELPPALAKQVKERERERIAALDPSYPVPAGRRSPLSEKLYQDRTVIPLATQLGWWVYHPHLSKFSRRGWPDLSMLRRDRALFAELKSDSATLSPEQADVIERMRAAGLEVYVWRPWTPIDEITEVLR